MRLAGSPGVFTDAGPLGVIMLTGVAGPADPAGEGTAPGGPILPAPPGALAPPGAAPPAPPPPAPIIMVWPKDQARSSMTSPLRWKGTLELNLFLSREDLLPALLPLRLLFLVVLPGLPKSQCARYSMIC